MYNKKFFYALIFINFAMLNGAENALQTPFMTLQELQNGDNDDEACNAVIDNLINFASQQTFQPSPLNEIHLVQVAYSGLIDNTSQLSVKKRRTYTFTCWSCIHTLLKQSKEIPNTDIPRFKNKEALMDHCHAEGESHKEKADENFYCIKHCECKSPTTLALWNHLRAEHIKKK